MEKGSLISILYKFDSYTWIIQFSWQIEAHQ